MKNVFRVGLACIPCREMASDTSQMVDQLLFGESYEVLEESSKWLKISSLKDGYESWIDYRQHAESEYSDSETNGNILTVRELNSYLTNSGDSSRILLSPGSKLPKNDLKSLNFNNIEYLINGLTAITEENDIISDAMKFLGVPYLWGGRSIWGIDCSGFVQVLFDIHGKKILRDASQQATQGVLVQFESRMKGDLAFFENEQGKITHVGILKDEHEIIHASGKVRIDDFDENGIRLNPSNTYTHKLHSIRRIDL